jgi:hypothetical protein
MKLTKDEIIKRAKALLELYEKADPALKGSIGFYLKKIHLALVNAEDSTSTGEMRERPHIEPLPAEDRTKESQMGITFGDHLINSGHHDITHEQEREIEAREECKRRGLDPDDDAADGVLVWMVVDKELQEKREPNVGLGWVRTQFPELF